MRKAAPQSEAASLPAVAASGPHRAPEPCNALATLEIAICAVQAMLAGGAPVPLPPRSGALSVGATVFGLGDVVSLGRDTGPTPDLVAVFLSLMLASPSQVNLEKATACRFANHSLVNEFLASHATSSDHVLRLQATLAELGCNSNYVAFPTLFPDGLWALIIVLQSTDAAGAAIVWLHATCPHTPAYSAYFERIASIFGFQQEKRLKFTDMGITDHAQAAVTMLSLARRLHLHGIAKHAGVEKFVDERALLEADGTAFKPQAAALQRILLNALVTTRAMTASAASVAAPLAPPPPTPAPAPVRVKPARVKPARVACQEGIMTPAQYAAVERLFDATTGLDTLVGGAAGKVSLADFQTLRYECDLSIAVLNLYMRMIRTADSRTVWTMDKFRKSRRVYRFMRDQLVEFDFVNFRLNLFLSGGIGAAARLELFEMMRRWLRRKKQEVEKWSDGDFYDHLNVPPADHLVILCLYANYLARGFRAGFDRLHVPAFRWLMGHEILIGQLL